jgi:hypothetical protein
MRPEAENGERRAAPHAHKRLPRRNPALRFSIAIVAVTAVAATVVVVANRSNSADSGSITAAVETASPSAPPSATASTRTPAPSTATPRASAPTAALTTAAQAAFSSAVEAVVTSQPGHGAAAVTDLTTGAEASFSDNGHLFDTGSIVKLDILATLLYQHQQAGTTMTSSQKSNATTMIENSDNDAANDLFFAEGGVAAITAANKVFGLTGTDVAYHWGTTTTDPAQQMILLKQVFTSDSVLTATSRAYIQGLMSKVESDQRWGVSAAASPGTSYMLKNGWLPDSDTGRWTVNSIGEVTYDGHLLLIAVQTDNNSEMSIGVDFAQQIAAAAAKSLVAAE